MICIEFNIKIIHFFLETSILNLCDKLRDVVLPELGVLMEDLGNFNFYHQI